MSLSSFESRFHQLLVKRVEEEADAIARLMAQGKARGSDAADTAQKYSDLVGYVRGLSKALAFCQEIESDLLGRAKK